MILKFTLGAKRLSVSGSTAMAAIHARAVSSVSGFDLAGLDSLPRGITGDPDARFASVRLEFGR